jgi:hypothetical protein
MEHYATTMSAAHRLLASGLATAAAQWALALASLLAMGLAPTTGWLAVSGVLTAAVTVVTCRLIGPEPPASDEEDGGGGPSGDDPEPPWWPDFERAFRAHAGRPRERTSGPA